MAITNGYATLSEVKAALRITDSVDDALIEMAVESASRLIDGYCNRNFYAAGSGSRYFVPTNSLLCELDDLVSITELATSTNLNGTYDRVWSASEYQLEPLNGKVDGLAGWPFTRVRAVADAWFITNVGEAQVKVTGSWGWAAVPMAVKQATVLQASRIFKRADSPLGVAGFGDMGVMRVSSQLDPDVRQLVETYRLIAGVA